MRPIFLGICAAFFFAFTFVLNREMELSGGSWIWSASLRYVFMIPFLFFFFLVMTRKKFGSLLQEMRKQPGAWLLWSFVGFGLFYAPLCFAAAYGPGWLIAGTWQITIISGSLIVPLFYETIQTAKGTIKVRRRIPFKGLAMSIIILFGVALMQFEHASQLSPKDVWLGVLPVIMASFAYPLGNRKVMEMCEGRLDAYQRVLGMTLASLPLWLILSFYGFFTVGLPSKGQITQSILVAIFSGVIATVLFFRATDMARGNMQMLAAVEATQSMEVLFAVAGELVVLASPFPSGLSWIGMLLVIIGMILHSYVSHIKKTISNSTTDNSSRAVL
ncbi:multidrug resistance efflux transporter family protein [Aneurinibacillus thermoaerophilus]|uniref:DMT family transporter n=1 Tax=Aneurinibacillus thermoaerophilus TaxID=143495 RepID=UPI002E214BE2|nr:multidrug resistance efflux transporter family protein [Aneurinibacillus thermoaerophilus]MED0765418.1 multidrug resistance efflux transporter family protein [Aneurinibacillus thermoaerophilus]